MKKMKLAVAFAALVSVFGFSSCLNDSDNGDAQYLSLVTVGSSFGTTFLYADEYPNTTFIPTAVDLTQYGIKSTTRRAMVSYTVVEGQDMESDKLKINLIAGNEWPVYDISHRPDTCADYNSPIVSFSDYSVGWTFKSGNIARDRYLNVGYQYRPYSKVANTVLLPNRSSNDTIYLDFKMKKEETGEGQNRVFMNTYDLNTCGDLMYEVTPVSDSIYVTVVGLTSEYGSSTQKDSVTARCKYIY